MWHATQHLQQQQNARDEGERFFYTTVTILFPAPRPAN